MLALFSGSCPVSSLSSTTRWEGYREMGQITQPTCMFTHTILDAHANRYVLLCKMHIKTAIGMKKHCEYSCVPHSSLSSSDRLFEPLRLYLRFRLRILPIVRDGSLMMLPLFKVPGVLSLPIRATEPPFKGETGAGFAQEK